MHYYKYPEFKKLAPKPLLFKREGEIGPVRRNTQLQAGGDFEEYVDVVV